MTPEQTAALSFIRQQATNSQSLVWAEHVRVLEGMASRVLVAEHERVHAAICLDRAVDQLIRIKSFVHPDGFVINGIGYSFTPPDALVREAWEALSKAIREVDVAALKEITEMTYDAALPAEQEKEK